MPLTFTPLENYGIIGNQETCALIGSNGSLDWLPLPYLDSPSACAALLDPERGEGAFLLCSFWLVCALSLSRRIPEAEVVFRQVLTRVGPLGLMSEEVEPATGALIGNFPQALSHLGLINAALHLGIAQGHGHQPPPQSEGEQQRRL